MTTPKKRGPGRPKKAPGEKKESENIAIPLDISDCYELIGELLHGPGGKRSMVRAALLREMQRIYKLFHDPEQQKFHIGSSGLRQETLAKIESTLTSHKWDIPTIA